MMARISDWCQSVVWRHSPGLSTMRQFYEQDASEWLAQNSPEVFTKDRDRLARHFALAEILIFFA